MIIFKLLFLLLIANGAPILLRKAVGQHAAWQVDGGHRLSDQRPIFGPTKTWRGVIGGILATGGAAPLVQLSVGTGLLVGTCSMLGDLTSSFIKRRLGLASSSKAVGLDQIPEALLPLLAVADTLALSPTEIALTALLFVITDLLISKLLYALHIREQPY